MEPLQADVVGLVRTLLIIAGVYYVLKFIGRLVLPWLMRKAGQKMNQQMRDSMNAQSAGRPKKEVIRDDGKVRVERTHPKRSSNQNKADDQDYVDFEEL